MSYIGRHLTTIVSFIILIAFFIICIYPVYWMFAGSLKSSSEFYTNIWGLPTEFNLENYASAWKQGKLGEKFINSIVVSVGAIAIMIPVITCAAYAIARLQFKGRNSIYFFLLLGIMMPGAVLGVPTFQVALALGLNNTRLGLLLIYAAGSIAMGVFIMRAFFIALPKGLEEAAIIDGCTPFQAFVRIIMPLVKPGIATLIIFNGLTFWNEYFFASIMLTNESLRTLPVAVANFIGRHGVDFPVLFATLTIITIPVIVVFIVAQRSFVEGLSSGAIKG